VSAGTSSGTVTATLQPALENAATAIGGLDVSHWKLSRDWKAQIQQDIDSIQQDLSGNLPALLQVADKGHIAPNAWREGRDRTHPRRVPRANSSRYGPGLHASMRAYCKEEQLGRSH
jgi:hypothetical protein